MKIRTESSTEDSETPWTWTVILFWLSHRQQRKQWAYHARREPDILADQHTKVVAPLKVLLPPPDVVAERSQARLCPARQCRSPLPRMSVPLASAPHVKNPTVMPAPKRHNSGPPHPIRTGRTVSAAACTCSSNSPSITWRTLGGSARSSSPGSEDTPLNPLRMSASPAAPRLR